MDTGVNIGTDKESVKEARLAIMDILESCYWRRYKTRGFKSLK